MTFQEKIFVIVLNSAGRNAIKATLDSVYKSDYPGLEVIIVDKASADGSFEMARKLYSRARFILCEQDLGRACAFNKGIRCALEKMADLVFLLESGTEIKSDTLSSLAETAKKSQKGGIFGAVIADDENMIYFAGGRISWMKARLISCIETKKQMPYESSFTSTQAMLVKKEVFREIGLLDEKFFFACDGADFCLRAGRKGFITQVVPSAMVRKISDFNAGVECNEKKESQKYFSEILFFRKNSARLIKPWVLLRLWIRKIIAWINMKFNKSNEYLALKEAEKDFKKLEI